MEKTISQIDTRIITSAKRYQFIFARVVLFIVYFWFGALKLFGLSPAGELVQTLYAQTIPFVSFGAFYIVFSLFECLIGVLFLIKGTERVVMPLLLIHLLTTVLPLILLPAITWQYFLVPTLEGQYIIKNLLIIALAIIIVASIKPFKKS